MFFTTDTVVLVAFRLKRGNDLPAHRRQSILFGRRADRPNQIWQADHTQLDILISGTSASSALNTAVSLRQAIWRMSDPSWAMCGLPDILHVDHGSDFTSHHLERTAIELHVRIIHSTIGHPQAEERSNGSLGP